MAELFRCVLLLHKSKCTVVKHEHARNTGEIPNDQQKTGKATLAVG